MEKQLTPEFDGPTIFGHPKGLMPLFFTEMWERFSYYGMRALLILFMTMAISEGGLGFDDQTSGAIYGLYTMGVYLLALPGGWLADRLFGLKKSVWYGGIIIAIGHFTMALPGIKALITGDHTIQPVLSTLDTTSFFLGLILIVLGTGLLKPNISSIVGQLYPKGSAKRDAGFSIFYMGINIGGFIAPIACGTLATYDMHLGFGLAGLGMIFGLIQYKLSGALLEGHGDPPLVVTKEEISSQKKLKLIVTYLVVGLMAVVGILFMGVIPINVSAIAGASGTVIALVAFGYLGYVIAFGGLNKADKNKVGVIAILFLFSAMFWSGFEQAGSTLNLFAERFTDRRIMGWEIPTSYFQSVNSLFIIIFAPIFGALWVWLGRRNLEPSSPLKFTFGLLLLGVGFFVMYFATKIAASGDLAAPTWLLLTYMLHTFGELSLSPVGLSLVTKLAPEGYGGQMMGIWFLSVALGNLFAGLIAGEASGGTEEALAQMPDQYMLIVYTVFGSAALLFLLKPVIRKMMGDVH
ncbi:POT family proton-dependent oligopeptide transporter [Algoriphagus ratkowskyi]|uniref:POT family proton-dependent oligopeptide transporter n=2 Tax=Algoriphagus ratkowskyi TaxID=57028 RepID=A0A2W7R5I0_9BACT|nr:peptide MFS transporter [Algoriphagus ratkowskyi]PZX55411.1 POT family proton-dependent oligopeptide transporter [Algoriphagus ratkowskyi]TXD79665.1 peptide MFS transporter [Algoriphagus ratkowskyi]